MVRQTMMLVNSVWNEQGTFKLIPTDTSCPYNEAIFDPQSKILVLISKEKKPSMQFLPKLDDNGDVLVPKRPRPSGKKVMEERRMIETFYEYYLNDPGDIKEFIISFAINNAEFEYKSYLK